MKSECKFAYGKMMKEQFDRIIARAADLWAYCSSGVWTDTRRNFKVNVVKTINLTIRSFLDVDLQSTACALTYRLLLAIVPIFALIFAIGRGFGFQNILTTQLFSYFPAQRQALETAFRFVDSYLSQTSEGIFVGIGLLFLFWTLISLTSSVEDAFNRIWGVKSGRSWFRKITDYTAIFLILPVLMVCSSGLTVFMSSTLQEAIPFKFMTPVVGLLFDFASVAFTWLFFTGVYMLLPNTKVRFPHALMSGILAGMAYQILQWLFVSGQLYVTKYNAIYGGFAFLPLLLIWLQLVWVITLAGAVLCYSAQNIMTYSFSSDVRNISARYRRCVVVAVMAVIAQRFRRNLPPLCQADLEASFGFPNRLLSDTITELEEIGMLCRTSAGGGDRHDFNSGSAPIQPARDINGLTIGTVLDALDTHGSNKFVPGFTRHFSKIEAAIADIDAATSTRAATIPLTDIDIDYLGEKIKRTNKFITIKKQTK